MAVDLTIQGITSRLSAFRPRSGVWGRVAIAVA
jgi:hypothetical protein